ncbi:hypothetical protein J31TS4_18690 [Paenibacillus sp. J31TS4]|nr:hypothetical protein J31TS4_18690 [Paenibacillus sp. J31TS4]
MKRGDKLIATVEKARDGLPTVLMVAGKRYVLDVQRGKRPIAPPARLK